MTSVATVPVPDSRRGGDVVRARRRRRRRPATRRAGVRPRQRRPTWTPSRRRRPTAVDPGQVVLSVTGPTRAMLTGERTALNLAGHLSGVATVTRRWVDAVAGHGCADPRHPQDDAGPARAGEVRRACGGGVNHRMSLSDAALVKDNHVVAAGRRGGGVRGGAADVPRPGRRGRVRHRRAGRRGHRRRRRPGPARQHGAGRAARGGRARPADRVRLEARRADARPRPGGRGDRRRLPGRRRADPLGAGARPRPRPAASAL